MSDADSKPETGHIVASVVTFGIFCLAGLLIVFGLVFVVPKFADMFKELDVALPVPTRLYLALGCALRRYWFMALPVMGLLSALPLMLAPRRAWLTYLVATVMALVFALGGVVFVALPVVKIQQVLSKRQ